MRRRRPWAERAYRAARNRGRSKMPGVRVDGNDAAETYAAVKAAVDRARSGEGPTLVEAMTYRMLGHTLNSAFDYVPKALQEAAAAAD